jgi:hypothetical protein
MGVRLKAFIISIVLCIILIICIVFVSGYSVGLGQIAKPDGTLLTSGGTPSVSSCGTSPTLASGSTDTAGIINVGSGVVTSCTLTFSTAMSSAPSCVVSTSLATVVAGISTTTSAATIALSVSLGSGNIHYHCLGR